MPTHGSPRPLWALAVFFGLATTVFIVWFLRVVPPNGCQGPPRPGVSALLQFQMARSPQDMEDVFGRPSDPCRAEMVAALDRANTGDLYGFIPTYGAFLLCFLLAMMRDGGGSAARLGLVALVAGVGFDVLETATQLRLTRELPGSPAALQALAIGSTGKYAALAILGFCAGATMYARGGGAGRIAALVCIAGSAAALRGLLSPSVRALLGTGTGITWIVIFLYAIATFVSGDRVRRDVPS